MREKEIFKQITKILDVIDNVEKPVFFHQEIGRLLTSIGKHIRKRVVKGFEPITFGLSNRGATKYLCYTSYPLFYNTTGSLREGKNSTIEMNIFYSKNFLD